MTDMPIDPRDLRDLFDYSDGMYYPDDDDEDTRLLTVDHLSEDY